MKRLATIIILIFFVNISFAQENINYDLIKKANKAYSESNFEKAVETYERILNSGVEATEIYYNLANSYYKLNKIPDAIINYERALLLSPNDEDIKFNLEIARLLTVDKIENIPTLFVTDWYRNIISKFNSNSWAIISIICFIIVLIFGALFLYMRNIAIRKTSFAFGIVFLIISIFTFSFSKQQKTKIVNRTYAIVFEPTVTVKSSPDNSGTDLFIIHEGLKVHIENTVGEWIEIKLADGKVGWLPAKYIRLI